MAAAAAGSTVAVEEEREEDTETKMTKMEKSKRKRKRRTRKTTSVKEFKAPRDQSFLGFPKDAGDDGRKSLSEKLIVGIKNESD